MNQYKIGDTVWTRKRGKCTVADSTGWRIRPYRIKAANGKHYYPVAENLYPSEAAMNHAIQDEFIRANPILCGWWNKSFTCGLFEIKPDPIQPKFKVGDAVYRNGQKYIVISISGQDVFYYTIKNEGMTRYSVKESDLRYWRETVLTHCLQITGEWKPTDKIRFFNTEKYDILNYVGNVEEEDHFIGYKKSEPNHPYFFRGIKGDDI